MTITEAIEALELARVELGGDAPLLMADGLHVLRLLTSDDSTKAVYVSDYSDEYPVSGRPARR
jgi:hypothetical protein